MSRLKSSLCKDPKLLSVHNTDNEMSVHCSDQDRLSNWHSDQPEHSIDQAQLTQYTAVTKQN